MTALRLLSSRHRLILLWLGVATLCLRMLAPAGFMPDYGARGLTLRLCSGTAVQSDPVHAAMPGMAHGQAMDHPAGHEGQPDQPCGFAGLTMPSLAAGEPMPSVIVPVVERVDSPALLHMLSLAARAHLRPPPIGPPTRA